MKKNVAMIIYTCNIPVGFLSRLFRRNRFKRNIDRIVKTYRCEPDTIRFASQDHISGTQKFDEDADCPDTLYPMW